MLISTSCFGIKPSLQYRGRKRTIRRVMLEARMIRSEMCEGLTTCAHQWPDACPVPVDVRSAIQTGPGFSKVALR